MMSHSLMEDCHMEKNHTVVTAVNVFRQSKFSGVEHADDDKEPDAENNKSVSPQSAENNSEDFVSKGEKVRQKVKPSRSMSDGKNKTASEPIKSTGTSAIKKRRKRLKVNTTPSNEFFLTRKHVRYLLRRINLEQNLIDAYSSHGWRGQSMEKIRPEKEIERAKSQILQCKLRIRRTFQHLDSSFSVGKLEENLFDDDGQINSEDIFCAKCASKDLSVDNDIILCDGNCSRGFHQKCLNPPLPTIEIPPEDEGWLCPACDCKVDCLDLLNEFQGSDLSIEDTWEVTEESKVFPEAAGVANGHEQSDDSNHSSDDSEDFDYNPVAAPEVSSEEYDSTSLSEDEFNHSSDDSEDFDYNPIAVPGVSSEESDSTSLFEEDIKMAICNKINDIELPSDDPEDDDYNPERSNTNNDAQNEGSESSESDFASASDDFCAELCKMNVNAVSSLFSDYKMLDGSDEDRDAAKKFSTNAAAAMEEDYSQENTFPKSKKRHREEAYGKASFCSSEDEVLPHRPRSKELKKDDAKGKCSSKPAHARTESACSQVFSSIKRKVMEDDDMTEIDMPDSDQSRLPEAVNESTLDRTHPNLGEKHGAGQNRITSPSPRNFSQQGYKRLREAFKENQYPSRATKSKLAEELGATIRKISKWFENTRHSLKVSAKRSNLAGTSSAKFSKEIDCPGTSSPDQGRTLTEAAENNTRSNEQDAKNNTSVTEGTGKNNIEGNAKNTVANVSSGDTDNAEGNAKNTVANGGSGDTDNAEGNAKNTETNGSSGNTNNVEGNVKNTDANWSPGNTDNFEGNAKSTVANGGAQNTDNVVGSAKSNDPNGSSRNTDNVEGDSKNTVASGSSQNTGNIRGNAKNTDPNGSSGNTDDVEGDTENTILSGRSGNIDDVEGDAKNTVPNRSSGNTDDVEGDAKNTVPNRSSGNADDVEGESNNNVPNGALGNNEEKER